MALPEAIRRIAADYKRLPGLLPTDTAEAMDNMGRSGTKVHSPIPIRADVHDLITDIERSATHWEAALRDVFAMASPYWTKNRAVSVVAALDWSAGIIAAPPLVPGEHGGEVPGVLPADVAEWITNGVVIIERGCLRLLGSVPRIVRSACPICRTQTMFTDQLVGVTRCVACGLVDGAAA